MKTVITCTHNGVQFYLTELNLATDIIDNAAIYPSGAIAHDYATRANMERAWVGFYWQARHIVQGEEVQPCHD